LPSSHTQASTVPHFQQGAIVKRFLEVLADLPPLKRALAGALIGFLAFFLYFFLFCNAISFALDPEAFFFVASRE
jgi:hypothetical protein